MDTLYIVMPAYNEEDSIVSVVENWYPMLTGKNEKSRLVIADSGSMDKTHEILLGLKEKYPQLDILQNTGRYHGSKVIALYDYAIKQGADYIFQTDSDGQTNASEFVGFWDMRGDYNAILGYRKIRGDGKIRAFVESVVCILIRFYFGVKVPDANAPFRLMRTETVKKYLYNLEENYNLPNVMLTVYFTYYDEKTLFKIITFKPRQGGKNYINIFRIIKIGVKAQGDFRKFKKDMRR